MYSVWLTIIGTKVPRPSVHLYGLQNYEMTAEKGLDAYLTSLIQYPQHNECQALQHFMKTTVAGIVAVNLPL